ncbi:MAG: SMC family ATPase [Bacteroidetes bacterium]|nr:SMC family ATPase [Bacteroidota bacterium]
MIITTLRLRNIKSFIDGELHFARGINIIAGRNGTGKSTVIEAVGLALFDAWPQRFKEGNARVGFLRNGTREGSIEIEVLRGSAAFTVRCDLAQRKRAGRESIDYERVLLDAGGAEIAKSAGRKKEFQEDLRRELLGEARIDDEKLFRDIIGTEQGAFDEPFTRIESDRRALFEKILGIEDFQDFEKQFYQLLKWQSARAKELGIHLEARGGVPDELATAESLLAGRDAAAKDAAATLKIVAKQVADARKAVDALTEQREALRTAQAEQGRFSEKQKGEEAAEAHARSLRDEAFAAAKSLEAARPGHEAYIAAEKELETLRHTAKQREATGRLLAEESTAYERENASLLAQRNAQEREHARLVSEIDGAKQRIAAMQCTIDELRTAYRALDEARREADARAAVSTDLRSYVQDLRSTRDALRNAGEKVHSLHTAFAALARRLDELRFEVAFLPALREETGIMFERHSTSMGNAEEDDTLAGMHAEATRIEEQLRTQARQAADLAGRKEQEGKGERKQLELKEKELKELITRREECEAALTELSARLEKLIGAWQLRSGELRAVLEAHGDIDARIAGNEALLDRHKRDHTSFLSQQSAAAKLEEREQALREATAAVEKTRARIAALEKQVKQMEEGFSEDDYRKAKAALDSALVQENTATAAHGQAKALAEEQRNNVNALRKEFRDFERLRAQAADARAEAAFTGDVHQHVVRELARRVGSSIVSALSAFASELYARIAPEQDLALFWDPETYAVELRGAQGVVRGRELSGGQLMGVSLAVKLALIKWYSQCRIGFLDEPTTHLDSETRRHLAEVIQHLEQLTSDGAPWFDQLFVISHEESFSGSGHRIELMRDQQHGSFMMEME